MAFEALSGRIEWNGSTRRLLSSEGELHEQHQGACLGQHRTRFGRSEVGGVGEANAYRSIAAAAATSWIRKAIEATKPAPCYRIDNVTLHVSPSPDSSVMQSAASSQDDGLVHSERPVRRASRDERHMDDLRNFSGLPVSCGGLTLARLSVGAGPVGINTIAKHHSRGARYRSCWRSIDFLARHDDQGPRRVTVLLLSRACGHSDDPSVLARTTSDRQLSCNSNPGPGCG